MTKVSARTQIATSALTPDCVVHVVKPGTPNTSWKGSLQQFRDSAWVKWTVTIANFKAGVLSVGGSGANTVSTVELQINAANAIPAGGILARLKIKHSEGFGGASAVDHLYINVKDANGQAYVDGDSLSASGLDVCSDAVAVANTYGYHYPNISASRNAVYNSTKIPNHAASSKLYAVLTMDNSDVRTITDLLNKGSVDIWGKIETVK